MEDTRDTVTILELRRLLIDLKDKRPDIGIRLRLMGSMWFVNFNTITAINEKGAMLSDDAGNVCTIPDLYNVIQFEIDSPFQQFRPFHHYNVVIDGR